MSSGELVNQTSNGDGDALSLRDLHGALEARGVAVSYKTLSEFTGTGDVGELLGAGGGANRRTFPPAAVDVLAAFWARYKEARGRLPQAPEMLRAFLRSSPELVNPAEGEGGGALVRAATATLPATLREFTGSGEPGTAAELLGALRDLAAVVRAQTERQEAQPPPADRALTRDQAAELLACSPRAVGRFVPALRPSVFRESDCRRYLATGQPQKDARPFGRRKEG